MNYTTEPFIVQRQFQNQEDFKFMETVASVGSVGVASLHAIPFCFSIVISTSIYSAWSFYLTLQVITNIHNYQEKLNIPASTWPILRLLQKISSFKITEEPLVKSWLNVNLYERIDHVKYFLFNQGTIFLTFLGLSFILLIVLFLRFLKVNQEL